MNFLAHIYLSGNNEELIVGNFIGDAIKGNRFNNYTNDIKQGILLHRKIDYFTDNHEIVAKSKSKLREYYRKHAGIVIDIFYDHFLAKNWQNYSNEDLGDFIQNAYKILMSHNNILPGEVMRYLPYMVLNNWLGSYKHIYSIKMILHGMSLRTSLPSKTNHAIEVLKNNYDEFDNEFNAFFKDIIVYTENELKKI
ncbi:ACP phosphodiesterase [Bacteroidota bacterium]